MQTIRYFGNPVDPAVYRRGFGVWGWLAYALNLVRIWLERRTAFLVLRVESNKAGLTRKQRKELIRQVVNHGATPIVQGDLPYYVQKLLRDHDPTAFTTVEERQKARYAEARVTAPNRPVPLEEGMKATFAEHQKQYDRSARYVAGRGALFYRKD